MKRTLCLIALTLCLTLCAPALCEQDPDEESIALTEAEETLDPSATPVPAQQVYMYSDAQDATGETAIAVTDSPDFVRQLLDVAIGELGYEEGANNLTKYGQWKGDPNAAWCAEFVCWCVNRVDELYGTDLLTVVYPNYSGQNTGRDWFIKRGRFVYRKGNCPGWGYQWLLGSDERLQKNDYIPRPGDLVFFSYNEAGDTEHVALVEYCARDAAGDIVIHVIEGNNPSAVQRNSYRLDNSQVLGFGACQDVVGTTMRVGNQGDKVLRLQQTLNELGLLAQRHLTGGYGGNTKRAIMDFQTNYMDGKDPTGIADRETQQAIAELYDEQIMSSPDSWLVED